MATFVAVITNVGRTLLATAASGGGSVIPYSIATGDGALGTTDPTTLTALIHDVEDYTVRSANALTSYQATFDFVIDSSTVTSTYSLREVGLYVKLNGTGSAVLLYYANCGSVADTITPSGSGNAVIDYNALTITFDNATNTVATITATTPPALHAVTHLHRTDGTSTDPIPGATSSDFGLVPNTNSNAAQVLLGGTTAAWGAVPVATVTNTGGVPVSPNDATQVVIGTNPVSWGSPHPTGALLDFAGSSAPSGWLLADGSSYSTTTYASLYAVIGHTYGGSGTSFNVPDFRGRTSIGVGQGTGLTNRALAATGGVETHALSATEMPSHQHNIYCKNNTGYSSGGGQFNFPLAHAAGGDGFQYTEFSGGNVAHTNVQPFLAVNKIIKY